MEDGARGDVEDHDLLVGRGTDESLAVQSAVAIPHHTLAAVVSPCAASSKDIPQHLREESRHTVQSNSRRTPQAICVGVYRYSRPCT